LPIRIKLADYIDDYYYQILYPPVLEQMRDYSSDNRTKFDFVVACGLAELADGWNGKACFRIRFCFEGTDHVWNIQRRKRSKRWGEIPVSSQAELKSIALEEERNTK
jgi:hypothetical protein